MDTGFSINENSLTNHDITVIYKPVSDCVRYSYTILKNNEIVKTADVIGNQESEINLTDTGNYKIEVNTFNGISYNNETSGIYRIDKEKPVIKMKEKELTITKGDNIKVLDNIKATDNIDGDISTKVVTNINRIDLNKIATNELVYTVKDTAGNEAREIVTLNIIKANNRLLISQIIVIITLIAFLITSLRYNHTLKLEKRLAKYSLKSVKENNHSLFETFNKLFNNIINKITDVVRKKEIAKRQSKKYEKYIQAFNKDDKPIRIIGKKVLISIIFLLVSFLVTTLRFQTLNIYEVILILIVGYYALDIIYIYKYHKYIKRVENDLLQAIIVMNNAFKSGRSITQAVELVGNELNGAISEEFKKMSKELSLGLDIEVVFKRFADRINIEEATYLTSSLSVLNKTGGNIIEVFNSIEKTLFNRKKLKIELKELTGSSRLIMWVLTIVPIAFVIIISLINPDYFKPLIENTLGFVIIGCIIVLYAVYIYVVRKIMNVRM